MIGFTDITFDVSGIDDVDFDTAVRMLQDEIGRRTSINEGPDPPTPLLEIWPIETNGQKLAAFAKLWTEEICPDAYSSYRSKTERDKDKARAAAFRAADPADQATIDSILGV